MVCVKRRLSPEAARSRNWHRPAMRSPAMLRRQARWYACNLSYSCGKCRRCMRLRPLLPRLGRWVIQPLAAAERRLSEPSLLSGPRQLLLTIAPRGPGRLCAWLARNRRAGHSVRWMPAQAFPPSAHFGPSRTPASPPAIHPVAYTPGVPCLGRDPAPLSRGMASSPSPPRSASLVAQLKSLPGSGIIYVSKYVCVPTPQFAHGGHVCGHQRLHCTL